MTTSSPSSPHTLPNHTVLWIVGMAFVSGLFITFRPLYESLFPPKLAEVPVPVLSLDESLSEAERVKKVDEWLQGLNRAGKFNGGVLVARNGEPLLMKAYGHMADLTIGKSLTEKTPFRLASVSKQFTASGILRLAELKKLDLDDPVSEHLEDFPFTNVKVRHLLNQTSGIPDVYMKLANQHRSELGEVLLVQDVPKLLERYPPEVREPGERFEYSNTNYVLLAAIVESAAGVSYEDFMREELFQPLGMQDSRVFNRVSEKEFPNRAIDLERKWGELLPLEMTWIDGVAGDGAVFCSLRDFLIWDQFWNSNDLISDELLQEAYVKPTLKDGSFSDYGFGWVLSSRSGRSWHNGSWLGARTFILRDTSSKLCLVVLSNASDEQVADIATDIEEKLFVRKPALGTAPKVSPFTEVRFEEDQVFVTFRKQDYLWLELDGHPVADIITTAQQMGARWQQRVAEDLVEVLMHMDHHPADTVQLKLRQLHSVDDAEEKADIVIDAAPMTAKNRSAVRWNRSHADEEAAYRQTDGNVDFSQVEISDAFRARLVGRYELNPNFVFDIQDQDGHLLVSITNQVTQEVFPESPTCWSYRTVDAMLEFKLREDEPAHRLILHQNGIRQHAPRVED